MSYYVNSGDCLWPQGNSFDFRERLTVGTYTVGLDPMRGFYLKPISDFDITGKIYGDTTARADRILGTFDHRNGTTGVLLSGEKGSGKTMLAKMISQKAAVAGMPTLVINSPFCGDAFNSFIQGIDEPCVIVFDEFEKVYGEEEQEQILTLLDGVFPSKKLFVLTVNNKYRVNDHMRNRPGRIFYMLEFEGLTSEFVREYCDDVLEDKSYIDQIVRLSYLFESFNFDMLKALVEEMNRYKESPLDSLKMLNAKPSGAGTAQHSMVVTVDGREISAADVYPRKIRGNPVALDHFEINVDIDPLGDTANLEVDLTPKNIKSADVENGVYTYVATSDGGHEVVLTLQRDTNPNANGYSWLDHV